MQQLLTRRGAFVGYLANKQIMAEVLKCMSPDSDTGSAFFLSGEKLLAALAQLLNQARQNGDVVADVEPLDILSAIAGVASFGSELGWKTSAERLIDILVAGLCNDVGATKK